MIMTIDGPSGAGKSTVARALATKLGLTYIDTGAMFRTVALAAHRRQIDWQDEAGLAAMLKDVQLGFQRVGDVDHATLDGQDVEAAIRDPAISQGASQVAVHPAVRTYLLQLQRALGQSGDVILEGRDTGSVVFPEADLKIFLEASTEERTKRRVAQLGLQGEAQIEETRRALELRDEKDSKREIAPLCCPEGAHRVDASSLSLQEVIDKILAIVQSQSYT